jgi:hypothetical protein
MLIFVLVALVLVACAFWYYNTNESFDLLQQLNLLVVVLVVGFALFFGIKRLRSVRRGEPVEDELSKKIMTKTASLSYYVSIYLWLAVMYFSDKVQMEGHTLIGTGIVGMAVIYALTWLFFNFRGIRNE